MNIGRLKSIKPERAACTVAFNVLSVIAPTSTSPPTPSHPGLFSKGSQYVSGGVNNGVSEHGKEKRKVRSEMGWHSELEAKVYL